jgi:hypothetical protein
MNPKAEFTALDRYSIVKEITGATEDTFPTAFPFGVVFGDMDLHDAINGAVGNETRAYRLGILMTAKGTSGGIGTVHVTGASEGGPRELVASLAITMNAVVETGDWRIVDTMVLPDEVIHLAGCSIAAVDSGNSRPAKFGFDAIGYRYIKFYVTGLTNITDLRIYVRHF